MSEFRGFIAVDINSNPKIENFLNEIEKTNAIIKLVELKNIHITLKFLGEISNNEIDKINEIIKDSIKNINPFKIQLNGTGVFPNENYIKIIWIGLKNTQILSDITKKINDNLYNIGLNIKPQKFHPHITIGRVKSAKNKGKILEIIEKYKKTNFSEILVDTIKLKKSELTTKGPIYTDILKIKLDKGDDKSN
jgi:2'-5' RNA ligase